jgi:hypothetical protein
VERCLLGATTLVAPAWSRTGGAGGGFLAVMLPAGGLPHDGWRSPPAQPLVAWRQVAHVAAPRSACDALQRDLALWRIAGGGDISPWDWAGYLVG